MTNLTRRTLMKGAAATGLVAAVGSRALAADEPLGIVLVVPSPVGDVGWGRALADGLEPVKAA
ncbi:twin-arginine translocation signal domain-containing protein, partial [Mesorhizobium sp. M1E.F.Ca.ET.041.01.1.1]